MRFREANTTWVSCMHGFGLRRYFREGELFRCWQALRKPNRDSEELYETRCPLAIKSSGGMHAEIEGVHACMHRLPVDWWYLPKRIHFGSGRFPQRKENNEEGVGRALGFWGTAMRWGASLGFPSPDVVAFRFPEENAWWIPLPPFPLPHAKNDLVHMLNAFLSPGILTS